MGLTFEVFLAATLLIYLSFTHFHFKSYDLALIKEKKSVKLHLAEILSTEDLNDVFITNLKLSSDQRTLTKSILTDTNYLSDFVNTSNFEIVHPHSFVSPNSIQDFTNISNINQAPNFPLNEITSEYNFWRIYPEQIHLSWTENEFEMRVTWVTYIYLAGRLVYRSLICDDGNGATNWTEIETSTISFDEGNNMIRIQYIHTGVMKNIKDNCIYEYMVGNSWFWSDFYSFHGITPSYSRNNSFKKGGARLIIIGDWGIGIIGTFTNALLKEDIENRQIDGIIHLGDLAYDLQEDEGKNGDKFLNMIQPIAAKVPYMTIPGNHESSKNFTHYSTRFNMPINNANEGKGWFYSYNLGKAHFIMMNLEQYYLSWLGECIEPHINWLIEDLKEAQLNRDIRPWIIFMSHRPFYCSTNSSNCFRDVKKIKLIEEILYENKIDLVLQAHVHNYERDSPVYNNTNLSGPNDTEHYYYSPKAPIYIVNGNAGNYEAHNDQFTKLKEEWFIYGTVDYGYSRLIVFNETHLHFEMYSSEKNQEVDYFWIIK
ncbi:hypothetical protein SteCoe_15197 [Stentor coeruleus]|uniref:Purple acid phosphatase n=1 Tax=Stentor coeruleus TaxID=5963 RepID=A0A1R2C489_9CILI|nr:hypothetical protein SteCoe_15197 [Stentor coeruleus]